MSTQGRADTPTTPPPLGHAQQTIILDLARSIAASRNHRQLFREIVRTLQPYYRFVDVGLFAIDEPENTHVDWATELPEISPSPDNLRLHEAGIGSVPHRGSLIEWVVRDVLTLGRPNRYAFDDLYARFPDYPQNIWDASPQSQVVRYCWVTVLRHCDRTVGMLCLNYVEPHDLSRDDLVLLDTVANQVAAAVSGVATAERLSAEKSFNEVLLTISSAVGRIQDRESLLREIYETIRPVFPYDEFGLFVVEPDGEHHYDLVSADIVATKTQHAIDDQFSVYHRFRHPGSAVEHVMERGADTFDLDLLPPHPHLPIMKDYGIRQLIGARLSYGGRDIGLICFNSRTAGFYSERHIPLVTAIAEQMSVAVHNILTNERVATEKSFKEALLAVSAAVGRIEYRATLWNEVYQTIKPIFPYDDFGLFALEEDELHHYELVSADTVRSPSQRAIERRYGAHHRYDHHGGAVYHIMKYGPGIYALEELPPHPQLPIMRQNGLHQLIGGPLRHAGRDIGMLCFISRQADFYSSGDIPLFTAIAEQIATAVHNVLAAERIARLQRQLEDEKSYLMEEVRTVHGVEGIVGESDTLQQVFQTVDAIAPTDATVLVQGETGTGKELIARAIHGASTRADHPLIKVNCAALPRELVESELFGHEKGAFTGAHNRRLGKFELAHTGTIFLDEIGELPLELQAKILHVIQDQAIERIGGSRTIRVDTRIIAATNRDLKSEVREGRFRADLFFRLNVVPILLPPLRERPTDIPLLADHFGRTVSQRLNVRYRGIEPDALRQLVHYDWPGNVRELENLVEQAVIMSRGAPLRWARPLDMAGSGPRAESKRAGDTIERTHRSADGVEIDAAPAAKTLAETERDAIVNALTSSNGRVRGVGGAAERLDIKPTTLEYRMKKLGIVRKIAFDG